MILERFGFWEGRLKDLPDVLTGFEDGPDEGGLERKGTLFGRLQ